MLAIVGLGPLELVLVAIFVGVFLVSALGAFGSRTTKLVLQRLSTDESPSGETKPRIELAGRQQGVISFLLTLVGVSPITELRVTAEEICCNSTSLFGRQNQAVPLRAVTSVAAGTRKPVGYLFVSFLFAFIGVFGGLGVLWQDGLGRFLAALLMCGALAALFIWLYAINKRFFFSIYTQGGPPILLSLKPNVIEGVPLDLDRSLQVVKIIRDLIVTSTLPVSPVLAQTASVPPPSGQGSTRPPQQITDPPPTYPATYEYDDVNHTAASEGVEALLQHARDLIKQGQRQEAILVLRDIATRFPMSAEAGIARSTLEKAGISV